MPDTPTRYTDAEIGAKAKLLREDCCNIGLDETRGKPCGHCTSCAGSEMLCALLAERRARDEADARALAGAMEPLQRAVRRCDKIIALHEAGATVFDKNAQPHFAAGQRAQCENAKAERVALLALLRSHEQHEAEKRALVHRVLISFAADLLQHPYVSVKAVGEVKKRWIETRLEPILARLAEVPK